MLLWGRIVVNCCNQAFTLKFRLLSTAFTSARLVNEYNQGVTPTIQRPHWDGAQFAKADHTAM